MNSRSHGSQPLPNIAAQHAHTSWEPLSRVLAFYSLQCHAATDNSINFWSQVVRNFFSPDAVIRFLIPRDSCAGSPAHKSSNCNGAASRSAGNADAQNTQSTGPSLPLHTTLPVAAIPWLLQMCWMCKVGWRTFAPGIVSQSMLPGGGAELMLQGAVEESMFKGCSLQQHANHLIQFKPDLSIFVWEIAVIRHRHVADIPEGDGTAEGRNSGATADTIQSATETTHGFLNSWIRFLELTSTLTNQVLSASQQGFSQTHTPHPALGACQRFCFSRTIRYAQCFLFQNS